MRYAKEDLERFTLSTLRSLDIQTKEEENLVQSIIDQKLEKTPPRVDLSVHTSLTDNMTPEKEKELQAQIDAKKASIKKEVEVPAIEEKKFCEFCDAVGPVKHKKNCTKPK